MSLRRVDSTVPRDLETIVHRAIAKDPAHRYASAAELRDELQRFLADRPIRSRPVSPLERYWRWCKRNPSLAIFSSAAFSWRSPSRSSRAWRPAATAGWPISSSPARRGEPEPDQGVHQRSRGAADTAGGSASDSARSTPSRVPWAWNGPRALARRSGSSSATSAIAAMALPDMRLGWEIELSDPRARMSSPSISRFERYAMQLEDGTIVVRRIADDRELVRIAGDRPRGLDRAAFSPDGRFLAVKYTDGITILDVWDLEERRPVFTDATSSEASSRAGRSTPTGGVSLCARNDGSIVFRRPRRWPRTEAMGQEASACGISMDSIQTAPAWPS